MVYLSYLLLAYVGVTKGLHRYWSHAEFKAGVWFEWVSLIAALLVGVYKPLGWIGIHRLHHKYADTDMDPHLPSIKTFFSWWDSRIPLSVVKDHIRNPRIVFFQRYGKYLIWPVIILCPYLPLLGIISMGMLNCFGHSKGKAVNRWWLNFFTPGEGNHDNHHRHS